MVNSKANKHDMRGQVIKTFKSIIYYLLLPMVMRNLNKCATATVIGAHYRYL